ncbi:MAG TPA: hypothetical protein VHF89_20260 [Solirubrobacteraceae bacterium]|nr:hypothetical protein [Solirubrobacteraceae bacterium]
MRRTLMTLALTAGLVGCGGEDKLSVEDYRTELRRICADSDRQTEAVKEPTRATPDSIADYLRQLRDINAKTIERVEDLEPPDELEDAHDRALEANREGREKVDAVIDELQGGGDPSQVLSEARQGLEESSNQAKQAARDIGVPECGD